MRPIRLEFTAFGSYPGTHVIDFDQLHELGIFVVTGPTGTGKSTIFDAMAFALYGKLPGDRPEGQVRSHHVPDTTKCEVTFRFEANGDQYQVTRSPGYMRAKKRGDGLTLQSGETSIDRMGPDGWEGLASKEDQVDLICKEALGLTAEQFERVVLLPQGKFQQFLLSNTKERRPLLQALFGTHIYERAAARIRLEAGEAKRKIEHAVTVIEQQVINAGENLVKLENSLEEFDGLQPLERNSVAVSSGSVHEALTGLRPRLDFLGVEAERFQREFESTQSDAATAQATAEQWNKRRSLRTQRDGLLLVQGEIEAERLVVARSQLHRPVAEGASAVTRAERRLKDAIASRDKAQGQLAEVLGQLGIAQPVAGTDSLIMITADLTNALGLHDTARQALLRMEAVQRNLADAQDRRDARLLDSERAAARVVEIEGLVSRFDERIAEIAPQANRAEELNRVVIDLTDKFSWRSEVIAVENRIAETRENTVFAEAEHVRIWDAFVAGNAPRLARDLQDGTPCPVCGSADHPDPAAISVGDIVEFADVEQARGVVERQKRSLGSQETEMALLLDKLGQEADVDAGELEKRLVEATASRDRSSDAYAEVGALEESRAKARDEHLKLIEGAAERATLVADSRSIFESTKVELDSLRAAVGDLNQTEVDARTSRFELAKLGIERLGKANGVVFEGEGSLATERSRLEELRSAAEVTDLEEAIRTVLDVADETERLRRISDHDSEWQRTIAGLETFEGVELPEESPDVTAAQSRADSAGERARTTGVRLAEANLRAETVERTLQEIERMTSENTADLTQYELLDGVASRCEGKGQSKVSLETWVLAGELDRVIAAANVHLQRMTSARYRLERTDEAGHLGRQAGLDLAVRDSFTGRPRPPASLSGGEQFQTSLSLALGLADVVSHGGVASGRRFEALFVDEGFGSLDPDALESAMSALEEIQKAGRMVGVITHVEAMKDVLPIGIRVDRLPGDRGSTLVVRPND